MTEEALFEDEYHVQQLIGCEVVLENGVILGELTDVLNLPGQDVLAIRGERGEILIPFISEFVPKVDIEKRKIVVVPPEGLLDLHESMKSEELDG